VDTNTTVGDDSGDDVLGCYGPASGADSGGWVIAADVTLTLKGSFRTGGTGAYLTMSAGSKISIATNYNGRIGIGSTSLITGTLTANGTAENWCEIDNPGTGNWYLWAGSGEVYCEDFAGSYLRLKNIAGTHCGSSVSIDHWIWDENCGDITPIIAIGGASDFSWDSCSFLNTSGIFTFSADASTGGERKFENCVITAQFNHYNTDTNIVNCVIIGFINFTATQKGNYNNCFLSYSASAGTGVPTGLYQDCFVYKPDLTNPHFVIPNAAASAVVVDGCVFEHGGANSDGDCVAGGHDDLTIRNCIILPGTTGNPSGTLVSLLGSASTDLVIYNNTSRGTLTVGETYAGHAGMVGNAYNNLFTGFGAGDNTHQFLTATDDIFTNCDHNSNEGVTQPYGNHPDGYAVAPGANDLDDSPSFFDGTRDFASWAVDSLGSLEAAEADQRQDAIDAFVAMNDVDDVDYNADATVANLIAYIRVGYTPQNLDYLTAGEGGSYEDYIGAVEPADLSPAGEDSLSNVKSNVKPNVIENVK
jgi:hypothetical protein